MSELYRMVVVLSLITGICTAALTLASRELGPRIEHQTDLYVRGPALARLFDKPAADVLGNKIVISTEEAEVPIFYATEGDNVSLLAIEALGRGGYGGDLTLMVGVDLRTGLQSGLEVVSHSETPGLGARIEEVSFRSQWQGLPADAPIALNKDGGDIDAISGATSTSRAAVRGTNEVVAFLATHKDDILARIEESRKNK